MESNKNLIIAIIALIIILLTGTVGYSLIQKWNLLDSLYMTIITITTVGYGEVSELSIPGKIFTIGLITGGMGVSAYILGSLASLMFEGEIKKIFGRRKLEKQIKTLKDHYIICGYGRIGSLICKELSTAAKPVPFVVVENDSNVVEEIENENFLFVYGNATEENILIKAGLKRAKGLVSVVSSNSDNVYITLSARELNNKLFILTRASHEKAEKKLLRAGADKVVSPYYIGGKRMAQAILRPTVVDFIELAVQNESMELQLEEITIKKPSALSGISLKDSGIRQKLGLIIVAIKKRSGQMVFNPSSESKLESDDTVLAIGEPKNLLKFEKMMGG